MPPPSKHMSGLVTYFRRLLEQKEAPEHFARKLSENAMAATPPKPGTIMASSKDLQFRAGHTDSEGIMNVSIQIQSGTENPALKKKLGDIEGKKKEIATFSVPRNVEVHADDFKEKIKGAAGL